MLKKYLPPEMDQAELSQIIEQVISALNQTGQCQFGAVMGAVMKKVGGEADGALVSRIVKQKLSQL